jgi:uncharacterized protein with PQ loop repeat
MLPLIVATIAPIINCIQLFPQLYKTYVTKNVKDLSFYSLFLIWLSTIFWLLHGYFITDLSLIVAGIVNLIINIILILLCFFYRKNRKSEIEKGINDNIRKKINKTIIYFLCCM